MRYPGGDMATAPPDDVRARMRPFREPVLLMLVALVTMSNIFPRNALFGVRVKETLSSDAAWHEGNRLGGMALLAAAAVWFLAAVYLPRRWVTPVGVAAVLLSFAVLFAVQGWTF